jgi:HEAT repeat protein
MALERRDEPAFHRDLLRGIQTALIGQREVRMPSDWQQIYPILIESPLPEVRERALALAVQFGDERAFTLLRKIVPDRAQSVKQREDALKTLLFQQKPDLVPLLQELLNDESLRGPAIRGLAAFDDAKTRNRTPFRPWRRAAPMPSPSWTPSTPRRSRAATSTPTRSANCKPSSRRSWPQN